MDTSDTEEEWDDDFGPSNGSFTQVLQSHQSTRASQESSSSGGAQKPQMGGSFASASDSASPTAFEPVIRRYNDISKSLSTSTRVISELNDALSSTYMDSLVKKTVLDQQQTMLQLIEIEGRLETQKKLGESKRVHLARLRKEHGVLVNMLELATSSNTSNTAISIKHASLNSFFTILLFILPLVAIFLAVRVTMAL